MKLGGGGVLEGWGAEGGGGDGGKEMSSLILLVL